MFTPPATTDATSAPWRELEFRATKTYHPLSSSSVPLARSSTLRSGKTRVSLATSQSESVRRMLWVDAVGGFLLCFEPEIVIGQPAAGATLPILGDISRRHAILRREAGGHVLEAIGPTQVDGRLVTGPLLLPADCLIQLGSAVRVRFRRPHALSATARLTIESGHRTAPAADAVLLMAESCVLGPQAHSHVVCRKWPGDVVLFRQGTDLKIRTNLPLNLDGQNVAGAMPFPPGTRLEGESLGVSLEELA
jgi:hypothetical protein